MAPLFRPDREPPASPSTGVLDVALAPILRSGLSRRNVLRLLAAGGATVVGAPLLAACGGGSGSGAAAGAASAPLNPTGTLKMTYHLAPNSMDPIKMTTGQFLSYVWPMYDTLTMIDLNGDVQPMLATRWDYAPDGSALTLTLRSDVKFHDGTPFDATAVKVNVERVLGTPTSPVRGDLQHVTGVEVVDPTTVKLLLNGPDAALPAVLGRNSGAMVSPKALSSGVDLNTQDGGSGAYKLVDAKLGAHAYYERFDGYWDPPAAAVKRLEIDAIADGQARLNGMRTGAYDLSYLTPTQVEPAKAAGLAIAEQRSLWYIHIALNWSRGQLVDPDVRRAIAHAFDRDAIVKSIYFGHAAPASGVFPDWYWASSPKVPGSFYTFDPAKSKQLLAGKDPVSFEMIFPAGSDPYPQFAALLQQQLKDVGITMTPRPVDINQLATEYSQGRTDALLGGGGQLPDPTLLFRTLFVEKAYFNPAHQTPPDLATAMAGTEKSTVRDQRVSAVQQSVDIIANDVLNVPLIYPNVLFAYKPDRVPSYTPSSVGAYAPTRGVGVT
ncbi:MAG: ABC transporter substrate-binding protein [Pseudonocardia sp.]|nr:ABC transporter substrate-binding protein [Pseudonocardia sp.]